MPHVPGHIDFETQLVEWEKKRQRSAVAAEASQQVIKTMEGITPSIRPEKEPSLLVKALDIPLIALPPFAQRALEKGDITDL
ncbi:hypothetical protein LCGC14_2760690, partial [marine sediment metagenome]